MKSKRTVAQQMRKEFPRMDWRKFGPGPVVGVDEVGRGCLAGPVYAAAVIFNSNNLSRTVTDSKLLSEGRRDELAQLILREHQVGLGFASVEEIDQINILQASLLAMRRAVEQLEMKAGHLLVDGRMKIPGMRGFEQSPIIKGDFRVSLIAAASIVAKVTRDAEMKKLSLEYPHYGFEGHKGYATKTHRQSIAKHGVCIHHRRSFAGVKEYCL